MPDVEIWGSSRSFTRPEDPQTAQPLTDGLESLCGGGFTPFALDYLLNNNSRCLSQLVEEGIPNFVQAQFEEFQTNYMFSDFGTTGPSNTGTVSVQTPNTSGTYFCIISFLSGGNDGNNESVYSTLSTPGGISESFLTGSTDRDTDLNGIIATMIPGNTTLGMNINGNMSIFGIRVDSFTTVGEVIL